MKSYIGFKKIAKTLEFLFAVMFISWLISQSFPYFFAIFNRFSTLLNRHFIFLLVNGIVATLLINFGGEKQTAAKVIEEYFIDEVVIPPIGTISCETPPLETVSEENQIIPVEIEDVPVARRTPKPKKCKRSRSNKFQIEKTEKIRLQRSQMEPHRKLEHPYKETTVDVNNLSNEEFQRIIEAFIARQQKFLRDESLATASA